MILILNLIKKILVLASLMSVTHLVSQMRKPIGAIKKNNYQEENLQIEKNIFKSRNIYTYQEKNMQSSKGHPN